MYGAKRLDLPPDARRKQSRAPRSERNLRFEQASCRLPAREDATELEGVHGDQLSLTGAPCASRRPRQLQAEILTVTTSPLVHDVVHEHPLMVGRGVHWDACDLADVESMHERVPLFFADRREAACWRTISGRVATICAMPNM